MSASPKRQRGQGMVGVLVSSSLLILMIAGVMQLLNGAYTARKSSQTSAGFSATVVQLTQILSDQAACTAALNGNTLYASATNCTGGACTATVTWEARQFLSANATKNGLTASRLYVQAVDDAWTLGSATKIAAKLVLELSKADGSGGRQTFQENFYLNVSTDGAGPPPHIVSCINAFSATPVPGATPVPCATPLPVNVVQLSANSKQFYVSWTGGNCNNGINGCYIEYQRSGYAVGSPLTDPTGTQGWSTTGQFANCDATVSSIIANLPGEGWNGDAPKTWSSVAVRLTRVYDDVTVATFPNNLTCSSIAPPGSQTPLIDEDCNSIWNNEPTTTTATTTSTTTSTSTTSTTSTTSINAGTCYVQNTGTYTFGGTYGWGITCANNAAGFGTCPPGSTTTPTSARLGNDMPTFALSFYTDPGCTALVGNQSSAPDTGIGGTGTATIGHVDHWTGCDLTSASGCPGTCMAYIGNYVKVTSPTTSWTDCNCYYNWTIP